MFMGRISIPKCTYVEVLPLQDDVALSPTFVKLHLIEKCCITTTPANRYRCQWNLLSEQNTFDRRGGYQNDVSPRTLCGYLVDDSGGISTGSKWIESPVVTLKINSLDPSSAHVKCTVRVYALLTNFHEIEPIFYEARNMQTYCSINEGTVVRILPYQKSSWTMEHFLGEIPTQYSNKMIDLVLSSSDPDTVKSLSLGMSRMLRNNHLIGTTPQAVERHQCAQRRKSSYLSFRKQRNVKRISSPSKLEEGTNYTLKGSVAPLNDGINTSTKNGLCVVDDTTGTGKTALVIATAYRILQCDVVHTICTTALVARYGSSADVEFESLVHRILVSAAVKQQRVCIIIDDAENLTWRRENQNDPYASIFNSISARVSHLNAIASTSSVIPYKRSFSQYVDEKWGFCLSVQFCIVGIVSNAPVSLSRSQRSSFGKDAIRMISPLKENIVRSAFRASFRLGGMSSNCLQHIPLSWKKLLPMLRGRAFLQIAGMIQPLLGNITKPSLVDIQSAISKCFWDEMSRIQSPESKSIPQDSLFPVGISKHAKLALQDAIVSDDSIQQRIGLFRIKPPTGILLYGAPGCGKTLLAKAVVSELRRTQGLNNTRAESFVLLRASDVVRDTVGSSEKAIVRAFETARANAPGVILIDEFESLFSSAGGSSNSVLASVLLQCMDSLCRWSESELTAAKNSSSTRARRVIVLGATNMPWMIDKSFLQPDRFDKVLYVQLPSKDERKALLQSFFRKMSFHVEGLGTTIESAASMVAEKCEGFSGGDLNELCRIASINCLNESKDRICTDDVQSVIKSGVVTASCDAELVRLLSSWQPS